MSKFLRVDFEIQPWGRARVGGIDMIASLSVHKVPLSGGLGNVVAISHVWGDAKYLVENVEGASHRIKISSPKKMERLLNIAKSEGWENLWVDNICINQEDNDEKAIEVMRMGSVYRETRATLILLDSTRSELLGETIPRILLFQDKTNVDLYGVMEIDDDMEELVGKVMELGQDVWYERLWTVQESALATRIYMAPIDEDIPYDVSGLSHCHAFLLTVQQFLGSRNTERGFVDPDHHFLQNFINRWLCSIRKKFTMGSALLVTEYVECSVAKDRVYGILGLIPKSRIIPAYGDTSLEKVAVTVMKDCVNNLKEMDLLHLRGPKLEEMGKCMVPSWESLVSPHSTAINGNFVHDGNCMYDENVGLSVSNPRIFEARIVAVIELDRLFVIEDLSLRCRALFKALKEKLHDDQILELIRGAMVQKSYPQYREESTAKEYFKIWAEIVSSHRRTWDVLEEAGWSKQAFARFERLWLSIDHLEMQKTYILGISKGNTCSCPCCKRTYIITFQCKTVVEDNLRAIDYGGHVSDEFVLADDDNSVDNRVPVIVVEHTQEGMKFISTMVVDGGFRHESKAFERDAITVV